MNAIQVETLDLAFTPEIPIERERKPTGGRRTPKAGFYARSGIHVSRTKRTVEPITEEEQPERPEYVPAPVSLPPVTITIITDDMIGLRDDPKAQEAAETYIRHAIAFHRKRAKKELRND